MGVAATANRPRPGRDLEPHEHAFHSLSGRRPVTAGPLPFRIREISSPPAHHDHTSIPFESHASAGMRSETTVRRRRTGAAAIERRDRIAFPQVKAGIVGLAGLNQRPHPYQLNAGNRCAAGRSRRSRSTVGARVMRSIRALVCVLLRLFEVIHELAIVAWHHLTSGSAPPLTCGLVISSSRRTQQLRCRPCPLLRGKDVGEAAQAPERSRLDGSKRKFQVGGDL